MAGERAILTWGRRIETLRVLRGWSQGQLAEAAGIAQSSLSEYESGKTPTEGTRERVEQALGLGALTETVHDLFEWVLQRRDGRWKPTLHNDEDRLIEEACEEMRGMFEATLRGGMADIRRSIEEKSAARLKRAIEEEEALLGRLAEPPTPKKRKAGSRPLQE